MSGSYFSQTPSRGHSPDRATWTDLESDVSPIDMAEGLVGRPILGESMTVNVVTLEPHALAAEHAHPEEQICLVLEGEVDFSVNGEERRLGPGMAVVVPPNASHWARAGGSGCRLIDSFHPPRAALVDAVRRSQSSPDR